MIKTIDNDKLRNFLKKHNNFGIKGNYSIDIATKALEIVDKKTKKELKKLMEAAIEEDNETYICDYCGIFDLNMFMVQVENGKKISLEHDGMYCTICCEDVDDGIHGCTCENPVRYEICTDNVIPCEGCEKWYDRTMKNYEFIFRNPDGLCIDCQIKKWKGEEVKK